MKYFMIFWIGIVTYMGMMTFGSDACRIPTGYGYQHEGMVKPQCLGLFVGAGGPLTLFGFMLLLLDSSKNKLDKMK